MHRKRALCNTAPGPGQPPIAPVFGQGRCSTVARASHCAPIARALLPGGHRHLGVQAPAARAFRRLEREMVLLFREVAARFLLPRAVYEA
jgi:hypothetical protein